MPEQVAQAIPARELPVTAHLEILAKADSNSSSLSIRSVVRLPILERTPNEVAVSFFSPEP